jgi:hypothetical protein
MPVLLSLHEHLMRRTSTPGIPDPRVDETLPKGSETRTTAGADMEERRLMWISLEPTAKKPAEAKAKQPADAALEKVSLEKVSVTEQQPEAVPPPEEHEACRQVEEGHDEVGGMNRVYHRILTELPCEARMHVECTLSALRDNYIMESYADSYVRIALQPYPSVQQEYDRAIAEAWATRHSATVDMNGPAATPAGVYELVAAMHRAFETQAVADPATDLGAGQQASEQHPPSEAVSSENGQAAGPERDAVPESDAVQSQAWLRRAKELAEILKRARPELMVSLQPQFVAIVQQRNLSGSERLAAVLECVRAADPDFLALAEVSLSHGSSGNGARKRQRDATE